MHEVLTQITTAGLEIAVLVVQAARIHTSTPQPAILAAVFVADRDEYQRFCCASHLGQS